MKNQVKTFSSFINENRGMLKHIKGLYEQSSPEKKPEMTNKIGTEGLTNITPEMVAAPPFKGEYSAYSISGEFNGVAYTWDGHGVENFGGVRGIVKGEIGTETIENLCSAAKVGVPMDAKKKSLALQFAPNDYSGFILYTSTSGKVVSLNY